MQKQEEKKVLRIYFPTIWVITPLELETLFGAILLEFSIGRGLGALKGLRSSVIQKPFSSKRGIS